MSKKLPIVAIVGRANTNDSGWFTLDNLPNPLHSQFPHFLEHFGTKFHQAFHKP